MNELRASNLMVTALERIVRELKGITKEDLTRAEKNILRIAKDAINERDKLLLGKKRW